MVQRASRAGKVSAYSEWHMLRCMKLGLSKNMLDCLLHPDIAWIASEGAGWSFIVTISQTTGWSSPGGWSASLWLEWVWSQAKSSEERRPTGFGLTQGRSPRLSSAAHGRERTPVNGSHSCMPGLASFVSLFLRTTLWALPWQAKGGAHEINFGVNDLLPSLDAPQPGYTCKTSKTCGFCHPARRIVIETLLVRRLRA